MRFHRVTSWFLGWVDRRIDARIEADRAGRAAKYWSAHTPWGRKVFLGATEEEAAHEKRVA